VADNKNNRNYSVKNAFSVKANLKSILFSGADGEGENLAALNGMRALCVTWVLLHHYFLTIQSYFKDAHVFRNLVDATPFWLSPIWHGELAVEVFFVLSGFLIGGSLMKEHRKSGQINVKKFYASRFLRLMPAYILALFAFSPFLPNVEYVWANLIYVSNYLPFDKMYMPWTWTLVLQEQFYLILPLFLLLLFYPSKNKLIWFPLLLIAASLVRYLMQVLHPQVLQDHPANFMFFTYPGFNPDYFNHFYTGLHVRFAPLVLGLLGAYLHVYHKEKLQQFFANQLSGYLLLIVGIGYGIYNLSIPYYDIRNSYSPAFLTFINVFSYSLFAVAVLILLLAVIYPNKLAAPIRYVLSWRIWYPVAQLSFVMYLFHMLFVAIACQALMNYATARAAEWQNGVLPMEWVVQFAGAAIIGTILFSLIVSLIIERPFMNFRKLQWFKALGNSAAAKRSEAAAEKSA